MLAAFGAWTATWEHRALCTVLQGRFIYANFFLSLLPFALAAPVLAMVVKAAKKRKRGAGPCINALAHQKKSVAAAAARISGFVSFLLGLSHVVLRIQLHRAIQKGR